MADPSLEWLRISTADAVNEQRETKRRLRAERKKSNKLGGNINLIDFSASDIESKA